MTLGVAKSLTRSAYYNYMVSTKMEAIRATADKLGEIEQYKVRGQQTHVDIDPAL